MFEAGIRSLSRAVDIERMARHLLRLAKDPLPYRRVNFTLPGHVKGAADEADDYLTSWMRRVAVLLIPKTPGIIADLRFSFPGADLRRGYGSTVPFRVPASAGRPPRLRARWPYGIRLFPGSTAPRPTCRRVT